MAKKNKKLGKGGYFIIGMLATALLALGGFAGYEAYENAQKSASESSTTSQNSESGVVASVAEARNLKIGALMANNLTGSLSFNYSVTPKNYRGTINASLKWKETGITDDINTFLTITNVSPTLTADGTVTINKLKRMTNTAEVEITCTSNSDIKGIVTIDDSGADTNNTQKDVSSNDFSVLFKNDGSGLTNNGIISNAEFDSGSIPLSEYTLSSVTRTWDLTGFFDTLSDYITTGTSVPGVDYSFDNGETKFNNSTAASNDFTNSFMNNWMTTSVSTSTNGTFTLTHSFDSEAQQFYDIAGRLSLLRVYPHGAQSIYTTLADWTKDGFDANALTDNPVVILTETFTGTYEGKEKTFTAVTDYYATGNESFKAPVQSLSTSGTSILF